MNRQPPTTRQRTKSACDRCAISRHKCDKGNPCLNCRKRSIECSYTRDGYEDAYQAFRQHDSPRKDDDSPQPMPQLQEDISTATVDIDLLPTISGGIFDTIDWDALIAFPVLDAQTLPPDPIATQTDCAPITEANVPDTSLLHHTNDALSAKCVEIETYIASFHSGVDQSALIDLITQETLNNCMTAYFDHFESIQALIHRPTFNITTTPPQLLTAMMLVGACYAHNAIPPEAIIQGAIHVLLLLQHSAVSLPFIPGYIPLHILMQTARTSNDKTPAGIYSSQQLTLSDSPPYKKSPGVRLCHGTSSTQSFCLSSPTSDTSKYIPH